MSETSNGHMHEVGKDLSKIKTPAEWDEATNQAHDLSTDDGFYSFMTASQENCGIDNTLTMINHLGKNDKAMHLEMQHIDELDALKQMMSADNIMQIADVIQNKSDFVSGLDLSKYPKEQKMQEQYMAKIDDVINYINQNAAKILGQA